MEMLAREDEEFEEELSSEIVLVGPWQLILIYMFSGIYLMVYVWWHVFNGPEWKLWVLGRRC